MWTIINIKQKVVDKLELNKKYKKSGRISDNNQKYMKSG